MSNSEQRLIQALKKASNQIQNDYVQVFTGIVTSNVNAFNDGTVDVQQIDGKIVSNILPLTNDSEWRKYNNEQDIKTDDAENFHANTGGPKIWLNVDLQAMPGDYEFAVPKEGTYVKVAFSTYQQPFILQMQDIDYYSSYRFDSDVGEISDQTGLTLSASASSINISTNGNTLFSGVGLNYTTIFNTQEKIGFEVADGAKQALTDTFILNGKDGAILSGGSKLSLKNNTTNLVDLLTEIKTALQDIAGIVVPPTGGSLSGLAPDLLVRITNIATDISNLLE